MPVQIGTRAEATFDEPFRLLSDCHRRVEMFLDVLVRLAEGSADERLSGEQAIALDKALRYFREAAPKHTADEEESVFPRLRERSDSEARRLVERAEALERDHDEAAPLHATVDCLGGIWQGQGQLDAEQLQEFRSAVTALAAMYKRHIAVEDTELFPAAEKLLNPDEKRIIGREMAARRGLPPNV